MAHNEHVARAPLFDRLIDNDRKATRELRPFRSLNRHQLLDSVRREVETLLNTRCHLGFATLMAQPPSVLTYGASDLCWVSPLSDADQTSLVVSLARTIMAFEPRLKDASVQVVRYDQFDGALYLAISGVLRTERLSEPVAFPVVVTTGREAKENVF